MSDRLILWHRWVPPKQEDPETNAAVAVWLRSVGTRLSVAGGTVIGTVGASVAASFEPSDFHDLIEMALDLVNEAEREEHLAVAMGVSLGVLTVAEDTTLGAAVERAQLLASRARPGEILLDTGARDLAASEFLFGKQVSLGRGAGRGTLIDRDHAHRADCAAAIATLAEAPLPPVVDTVRARIEDALVRGESRTFILRGPVGAGATEVIDALERSIMPGRVLSLGASPGGVVPLASLRLALARRFGSPEGVRQEYVGTPELEPAAKILEKLTAGDLVPCEVLSAAIARIARAMSERPWVVLNPLGLVDGASLAVLLEARQLGADFVLFGRYPVETPLPRPIAELEEPVIELTLPPLKTSDARVVAEAILGPATDGDIARRVAVLGGDTVIGVVEAARTLIATGELVQEENGAFTWRLAPRGGGAMTGTMELLSERLHLLDPDTRRVLEAVCVVPDGSPRELVQSISALDRIGSRAFEKSTTFLARDGLILGDVRPRPASSLLRWRVISKIPPARSMELHRFVGEVLRANGEPRTAALRAELGFYLLQGGLDDDARPRLADAAEAMLEAGYERAARQLSGWVAQHDQERAMDHVGHVRPTPPPPPSAFPEEGPPSSEFYLDELLEQVAEAEHDAAVRPPPKAVIPPPKRVIPPPPSIEPVAPIAAITASIEDVISDLPEEDLHAGEGPLGSDFPFGPTPEDLDSEIDALLSSSPPEPFEERGAGVFERDRTEPPSRPPPSWRPLMQDAVKALRERDFDTAEETMQRVVAEGGDLGAVGRVRAMAEMARGDLEAARLRLRDARMLGRDDLAAQARYRLSEALLELHAGDPVTGIRAALAALSASRTLADARGEAAARMTLAGCYRALGRDAQAARLEETR